MVLAAPPNGHGVASRMLALERSRAEVEVECARLKRSLLVAPALLPLLQPQTMDGAPQLQAPSSELSSPFRTSQHVAVSFHLGCESCAPAMSAPPESEAEQNSLKKSHISRGKERSKTAFISACNRHLDTTVKPRRDEHIYS